MHLELSNDGIGELSVGGATTEIASQDLAVSNDLQGSLLDLVGKVVEVHVSQHKDRGEQESSGVGLVLASDIGSGTVDSLKDGGITTNVTGGCQTETTDKTSAHIGKNISVQVGHDHDGVGVDAGILDNLQAGAVQKQVIELDLGELTGNLLARGQEETIGQLHDVGLVDSGDTVATGLLGIVEGIASATVGGILGDQLDGLDNTIDDLVLNARVLSLGVLADEDGVNVVVGGLESNNRLAGADVSVQVEGTKEGGPEKMSCKREYSASVERPFLCGNILEVLPTRHD